MKIKRSQIAIGLVILILCVLSALILSGGYDEASVGGIAFGDGWSDENGAVLSLPVSVEQTEGGRIVLEKTLPDPLPFNAILYIRTNSLPVEVSIDGIEAEVAGKFGLPGSEYANLAQIVRLSQGDAGAEIKITARPLSSCASNRVYYMLLGSQSDVTVQLLKNDMPLIITGVLIVVAFAIVLFFLFTGWKNSLRSSLGTGICLLVFLALSATWLFSSGRFSTVLFTKSLLNFTLSHFFLMLLPACIIWMIFFSVNKRARPMIAVLGSLSAASGVLLPSLFFTGQIDLASALRAASVLLVVLLTPGAVVLIRQMRQDPPSRLALYLICAMGVVGLSLFVTVVKFYVLPGPNYNLPFCIGMLAFTLLVISGAFSTVISMFKRSREFETLQFSEEEYRIAASHSEKMIIRYELQTRMIRLDPSAAEHFGTPEIIENLPESLLDSGHIHPNSKDDFLALFSEASSGESSGSGVIQIRNKNGEFGWYRLDFTNMFNTDGTHRQAVVSLYDITDLREKELTYERWHQTYRSLPSDKMSFYECNLSADTLDREEGDMFDPLTQSARRNLSSAAEYIARRSIHTEDVHRFLEFCSRRRLLESFDRRMLPEQTEFRRIDKSGQPLWTAISAQMVLDPFTGDVKCYLMLNDIDDQKRSEIEVSARSNNDTLTGLLNRTAFISCIEQLFAANEPMTHHALIMIDLDNFKLINDTFGHQAGDQFLIDIASDLKLMLRADDLVCRLGGDEFIICLKNIVLDTVVLERRAQHICQILKHSFDMDITVTGSIGVAIYPGDGLTFEELYHKADIALYRAKHLGKNRYVFYSADFEDNWLPGGANFETLAEPATESSLPMQAFNMAARRTLLVVDDVEINRVILSEFFKDDYDIIEAFDGQRALDILTESGSAISAVLLDIMMPGMNGIQVLEIMAEDSFLSNIPVIVTSAEDEIEFSLKAIELGAVDYVSKPIDSRLINVRVRNAITRREIEDLRSQNRILSFQQEEEAKHRDHFRYLAEYHQLTGIYNTSVFEQRVNEFFALDPQREYAIVQFDINRFRVINDMFGHDQGDNLLKYVADCLKLRVGAEGVYCHMNTDNFGVCVGAGEGNVERFFGLLESDFKSYNLVFEIMASYGVYITDGASTISVGAMLDRAAIAKRTIKGNYITRMAYYDETMRRTMLAEQDIVSQMGIALAQGQFVLYLQPKCRLDSGDIVGAEVLVRWNHPEKGIRLPGEFIPVFEKSGFIMQLDAYVWEETCHLIRRWLDNTLQPCPISVSANISRISLYNPNLCRILVDLVAKYDIPRGMLELEITESAYSDNPQLLAEVIHELQENGFTVQMDDFGSGYSSLNMLKDIPVDILKLDMNFLAQNDQSGRAGNILTSVVRMARWLNLPVIAEGVETDAQAQFLRSIGCANAQGYHFYRPMPVSDFEKLMRENRVRPAGSTNIRLGSFNTDRFWSIDDDVSMAFNSIVGAAGVFELVGETIEPVRGNDQLFELVNSSIESFYEHGTNASRWIHPDDLGIVVAAFSGIYGTDNVAECDYRRVTDGDSNGWMHMRARFLSGDESRSLYYVSLTDTLELVRTNRLLEAECEGLKEQLREFTRML